MNFAQAVTSCFQKYATFNGRAPRSEYWYWFLFCFIIGLISGILDAVFFFQAVAEGAHSGNGPINTIFTLATLLPGLAVTARRLHDTDRSGWWMLIAITIIGIIPLLIWYCTEGTRGANRFGDDPLKSGN